MKVVGKEAAEFRTLGPERPRDALLQTQSSHMGIRLSRIARRVIVTRS